MSELKQEFQGFILVKFIGQSKEYTFGSNHDIYTKDAYVVVETARGVELGIVSKEYQTIDKLNHSLELKPALRVGTEHDYTQYKANKVKAFDARRPIEEAIEREKLNMNVVDVEYTLDAHKLIITYVSDNRVDFRGLLKELTTSFPCRIELKQIGQRDKAKMVGGLGVCGRTLCCHSHLKDFDVVSINMAKNQMLSLNMNKLSGQCGKLKCCLRYENDEYTVAKEGLPKLNSMFDYKDKKYKVREINLINQQITLSNREESLVLPFNEIIKDDENV